MAAEPAAITCGKRASGILLKYLLDCRNACVPPKRTREMAATVLIVDDSKPIRECVRDFLFYNVGVDSFEEAQNGREAVAKAQSTQPIVIVLDQNMPLMTGLEAAPALKLVAPGTHIILFTLFDFHPPVSPNDMVDATVSKLKGLDALAAQVRAFLAPAVEQRQSGYRDAATADALFV